MLNILSSVANNLIIMIGNHDYETKHKNKMDLLTNIQRVENMIYSICGCSKKDAEIVLKECLKRNKKRIK